MYYEKIPQKAQRTITRKLKNKKIKQKMFKFSLFSSTKTTKSGHKAKLTGFENPHKYQFQK